LTTRRLLADARRAEDLVAVVVSTRPYAATELIPILVRNKFTSIERGRADALVFVQHLQPDVILGVIDATRFEDLELLRTLARATRAVIVVLAATNEAAAASLRAGADFYLRDSDGPEVLEAQFVAIRRRLLTDRAEPVDDVIEAGPLEMNRSSRRALLSGKPLVLSNFEFSLLLAFAEQPGRVLSPLEAARNATGKFIDETEAVQTVKVYVRRLRQKFEAAGASPALIVNVRGRGYLFDPRASSADLAV
jgi:DNA-binding response OmpR family regulator